MSSLPKKQTKNKALSKKRLKELEHEANAVLGTRTTENSKGTWRHLSLQ